MESNASYGNDNETFRVAQLGIEVRAWFNGRIGAYVLERAESDVQEAFSGWLDTDSKDDEAIRKLQEKANSARLAVIWLNEAIADGETAERNLNEE